MRLMMLRFSLTKAGPTERTDLATNNLVSLEFIAGGLGVRKIGGDDNILLGLYIVQATGLSDLILINLTMCSCFIVK